MKIPWRLYFSEMVGTACLVAVGLSIVILDFGDGSPVIHLVTDPGIRRLITGFLFGSTGALIAISPVGKWSGAHINPVVTLAFWLMGKMRASHAIAYFLAQLIGAIAGALPLLLWGSLGASVHYGATQPGGNFTALAALGGEIVTTWALIEGLFLFLSRKNIRKFTPLLFPFLYAFMVFLEAPLSGTSTNPARSLGPAVISGDWRDWWVYWIGPLLGTLIAILLHKATLLRVLEIEVAKLYHFEHDPYHIFGNQPDRPVSGN
jgi:aquaporin Z